MEEGAFEFGVSAGNSGETFLFVRRGDTEVGSVRLTPVKGGKALEQLRVDHEYRGKGLARRLIQLAKEQEPGNLYIKPRPYGDMPMSVHKLKAFYASEGFETVDDKDNMMLKRAADETLKTVKFQGILVNVDRPKGFVQRGKDSSGAPWERSYLFDYGSIPNTNGGDRDHLDVFIGPNKKAREVYWIIQHKEDGSFDEYKVFLGFDSKADARKAYVAHIPKKFMGAVVETTIGMLKSTLGMRPTEMDKEAALWCGFMDRLAEVV